MSTAILNTTELDLDLSGARLEAEFSLPQNPRGFVIFAHGSGSSRHTYRNCDVAGHLQSVGFATLLFNLLTRAEEAQECIEPRLHYDVPFLARRLVLAVRSLQQHPATQGLRFGLFGGSTGATAAIIAAAQMPELIDAVVSRGGRPDLAGEALRRTLAPTLLLVGGWDDATLQANRAALSLLRCEKRLEVIPRATHRFIEPGAISRVAELAAAWFQTHLARPPLSSRANVVTPTHHSLSSP